jgi:hypothetical protein
MAKPMKQKKRPTEINELANYLVTESAREGEKPDRATDEQVSLIMAESGQKAKTRATPSKKRKTASRKARPKKA